MRVRTEYEVHTTEGFQLGDATLMLRTPWILDALRYVKKNKGIGVLSIFKVTRDYEKIW